MSDDPIGPSRSGIRRAPSDGSAGLSTQLPGNNVPPSGTVTFSLPQLKPATTYTVTGTNNPNLAHLPCFSTVLANFGTFTTQ